MVFVLFNIADVDFMVEMGRSGQYPRPLSSSSEIITLNIFLTYNT